jgi:hypothetical protein
VYEKRRRYNQVEATAVVDEIYRRVMDPKYDGASIGVIAFSISQQNCIEDALDERASKDSRFFARLNSMPEEMFIKNLETVQGDERDLILFSIGYGPSKDGVVAQSFGPINRAGGGRRLNVAVSRARKEMVVFSSMRYTSVKLTPSSSNGVRGMREFLRFAENGGRFGEQDHGRPAEGASKIIEDISSALRSNGYDSHFGIGNSGFKVDLAVVDPENPEEYLLGILNDGDSYRASENTRDREFARADVLVRMGWNIIHVWSVDWFFSKKQTLKRILDRIAEIMEERRKAAEKEAPEETVVEPAEEDLPEPGLDDSFEESEEYDPEADITTEEPAPEEHDLPEDVPDDECDDSPAEPEKDDFGRIPYVPYVPKEFDVPMDAAVSDREAVRRIAGDIIAAESPVTEEHLLALYRKSAGIKRLAEPKRSVLIGKIRNIYPPETRDGFVTYWAEGADRDVRTYRVADAASGSRDISAVPLKELLNACADVVEVSVSIPRNACVTAVGKALGYKRAGINVVSTVEKALDIALEDGIVVERNGNLMMPRSAVRRQEGVELGIPGLRVLHVRPLHPFDRLVHVLRHALAVAVHAGDQHAVDGGASGLVLPHAFPHGLLVVLRPVCADQELVISGHVLPVSRHLPYPFHGLVHVLGHALAVAVHSGDELRVDGGDGIRVTVLASPHGLLRILLAPGRQQELRELPDESVRLPVRGLPHPLYGLVRVLLHALAVAVHAGGVDAKVEVPGLGVPLVAYPEGLLVAFLAVGSQKELAQVGGVSGRIGIDRLPHPLDGLVRVLLHALAVAVHHG